MATATSWRSSRRPVSTSGTTSWASGCVRLAARPTWLTASSICLCRQAARSRRSRCRKRRLTAAARDAKSRRCFGFTIKALRSLALRRCGGIVKITSEAIKDRAREIGLRSLRRRTSTSLSRACVLQAMDRARLCRHDGLPAAECQAARGRAQRGPVCPVGHRYRHALQRRPAVLDRAYRCHTR